MVFRGEGKIFGAQRVAQVAKVAGGDIEDKPVNPELNRGGAVLGALGDCPTGSVQNMPE